MIPRSLQRQQPPLWQTLLGQCITDVETLWELLDLPRALLPKAKSAARQFRLRVPVGFVQRMRRGDPDDPLLRQILPLGEELVEAPGYEVDPLEEQNAMPVPGLLHKYPGRVLLTLTGACAVNCRYCFRRHYPYNEANPTREHWPATLDYLAQREQISEVILSGGDPLTLTDARLKDMVEELELIPHLTTLRLHSRVPVVLPERVDSALLDWMSTTRLRIVVVIHCNHANEINAVVASAMQQMKAAGATLLNQSVLLRGVNDDAITLCKLGQRLFEAGVLPYYLHQLDPVQGASHFAVSDIEAQQLMGKIRSLTSGYLIPRLVREIPGESAKIPL
ncbi:L-lysine 2,3-aminomutase [Thiogranum longum]|uniref:L-lysine 2,3-aminomutase n=1 Tax=Thiogranum longum TaxID=1537524 RepID=A0A4R1H6S9_9GAMM|nr:EF-P beta-lysylation protein EpmB [Thiogranum longum]TCK17464.1 L-lysine 2,3-aminomutase [Thiogranum longum]